MERLKHYIRQTGGIVAVCLLASCVAPSGTTDASLLQAGVSQELAEYRKENFGQIRYHLFFSIPEQKEDAVTGKVEILLTLEKQQPVIIDFRGEPEQIKSVQLSGKEVSYTVKDEHIVLDAKNVAEGENRVEISFTATDQSLNRRDEFLYTLLVPDRARTLFPCFDQPDMKSLFSLSLEVPASWRAVANGAVEQMDSTSVSGRKHITFRETEPLSTYLFSFVAGKLSEETFKRGEREISIYYRETDPKKIAQCPDIAAEVFDALEWQEAFTNVPYPFAKYDLIILPGFQYGGMEHTGATLYNDNRMFLNENPTLNERLVRSSLIAHETAHMWYGDFVTMKWFDDVWTKEVFANYFASQIVEPHFPDVNHRLNFMLDYLPAAYAEDRTAGANPIKQDLDNLRNAGLVYGNIIYTKSPVVMEMLVQMMGKEAFRQGIQEYLKTYAYGNATWDGLISILSNYTDQDLKTWSHVWVNEKGMPEIRAEIKGDSLVVSQSDPWKRGLRWPQTIMYSIVSKSDASPVSVRLQLDSDSTAARLKSDRSANTVLVPNADGAAYGFFRIRPDEMDGLFAVLKNSKDEVMRGSILITLHENLLNQTIPSSEYLNAMLDYLPTEKNALLYSIALRYITICQRLYPSDITKLEQVFWRQVTASDNPQFRLQAFRSYLSVAESEEALNQLHSLWKEQKAPGGCSLSENDYISLSYTLAIKMPEQAAEIVALQRSRITNPDRQRQYDFISPSVSPQKAVRDSVFNSLLVAENRRVEPWASAALANLNSYARQQEAIAYIRPALEAMQEVQRTGDIFFPRDWARALLGGHTSGDARWEVDSFFAAHPDYPAMLSNKIRQQADHLYRLK